MIRPVELALGEPHVDTRSGPPPGLLSGDAFLFAEKWAAAADALARDPVLALAPLRALRDRRFVRPRPGANGWPTLRELRLSALQPRLQRRLLLLAGELGPHRLEALGVVRLLEEIGLVLLLL